MQDQAYIWTPIPPRMTKTKTFRSRHHRPLEIADQKATRAEDGVVEPEEGKHPTTPVKTPLKIKGPWALRSNQRTPKASITSYNQVTARYHSTIEVTPCATIAAYQAIRDPNVDSDLGIWTTASKDLSTPLEATYHPEINYERKLKSKYPMQPNYGVTLGQANPKHRPRDPNGQTITTSRLQ